MKHASIKVSQSKNKDKSSHKYCLVSSFRLEGKQNFYELIRLEKSFISIQKHACSHNLLLKRICATCEKDFGIKIVKRELQ